MNKRISLLLIILLFAMTWTGCEITDPNNAMEESIVPNTPTPTERVVVPQKGGTLKVAMRMPKTLNPLLNEDETVDAVLKLIYEPLLTLDATQKPIPKLAESFNFATDGLSVVVTLKSGSQWDDGSPITSEDILFSLGVLRDAPETAIYKQAIQNINIAACTAVDERTVKIIYWQPFSGSGYLLRFPIIPKHYYEGEINADSEKNMKPVGNGLYMFDSYTLRKEMKLVKSTTNRAQDIYIENITASITSDTETDLYSFDQGIIDVVSSNMATWSKYRTTGHANISEFVTSYYDFIGFNFNNPALADKKIRQAIAHSIDVDTIMDEVYLGHAVRAFSPVSPESWLYEASVTKYDFDLAKAGNLFTEPIQIRILVNEENEERGKIAVMLKENLSGSTVDCVVESVPFEEYQQKLRDKDFDIFVGGFNLSVVPDLTFAFHSSQTGSTGMNYFSYSNETMDNLLLQSFGSVSDLSFQKSMSEFQKFFSEEIPCISLVFRKSALLTTPPVMGDKKPLLHNLYDNIQDWFIDTEELQ